MSDERLSEIVDQIVRYTLIMLVTVVAAACWAFPVFVIFWLIRFLMGGN